MPEEFLMNFLNVFFYVKERGGVTNACIYFLQNRLMDVDKTG